MLQLQTLVRLILIVPALVLVSFAALPSPALAQIEMPPEPVRVVTKEIEPFVSVAGATPSGFSIELWNAMALDAGIPFDYVIVDTVQEQLAAVESGEADAAIAAITITQAREEQVDFSFSYFDAGLGILIDAEQRNHPMLGVF
jgi:polar amino acid transport system substrate-binding protein